MSSIFPSEADPSISQDPQFPVLYQSEENNPSLRTQVGVRWSLPHKMSGQDLGEGIPPPEGKEGDQ